MVTDDNVKRRDASTSSVPRLILLALLIGAHIVLLLSVAENRVIGSDFTQALLWPGLRLAQATGHSAHGVGVVLVMIVDSIVYGFVSFLMLCLLRNYA
jgi:hypothetical protein